MIYLLTKMSLLLLIAVGLGVAIGTLWQRRRFANVLMGMGTFGNIYDDSRNTEERLDGVKKPADQKKTTKGDKKVEADIPDSARVPLSNDPFIDELDEQIRIAGTSTLGPLPAKVSSDDTTGIGIARISDEHDYERMQRDFAELQSTIGDLMREVKGKNGKSDDIDGETTASQMSSGLRAIQEKVSFFEQYVKKTRNEADAKAGS